MLFDEESNASEIFLWLLIPPVAKERVKSFVDQSHHPFQDESAQPFTRKAVESTANETKSL